MKKETYKYDIIRRPIITEKATMASEAGTLAFEVSIQMKMEIVLSLQFQLRSQVAPCICSFTQSSWFVTRLYTPGWP